MGAHIFARPGPCCLSGAAEARGVEGPLPGAARSPRCDARQSSRPAGGQARDRGRSMLAMAPSELAARSGPLSIRLIVCFLLLLTASLTHAADLQAQRLVKGESSTITTDYDIGDAAITDLKICDYVIRDNRREVYLNARSAGAAMLTLWDLQGVKRDVLPITVQAVDVDALGTQARRDLQLPETVRFVQEGDRIVIEGAVDSEAEMVRVRGLAQGDQQVESRVRLSDSVLEQLTRDITQAIARPGITVRRVQNQLVLEGIAYSTEAARYAEQIARLYHPEVLNLIEIRESQRSPGKRPLVQLDLYFMEVKHSALRGFGIRWTPGAIPHDVGGGVGGVIGTTVGFLLNLLPKLQWARERGEGRILEHATLIVKSGEVVDFFSGAEIPYTTEQSVQFKEVGIKVQAEPIAYGTDVDLKITTNISAPSSGVNQAIDRRSVATSAYCRDGQSMVLGGLWSYDATTSRNRIPPHLNTSSAIFTLALSKDFQSRQSEFLVFVQPRILAELPSAEPSLQEWEARQRAVTPMVETSPVAAPRAAAPATKSFGPTWRRTSRMANGDAPPTPDHVIQLPEALQ